MSLAIPIAPHPDLNLRDLSIRKSASIWRFHRGTRTNLRRGRLTRILRAAKRGLHRSTHFASSLAYRALGKSWTPWQKSQCCDAESQ
jgi:hypothetical protein